MKKPVIVSALLLALVGITLAVALASGRIGWSASEIPVASGEAAAPAAPAEPGKNCCHPPDDDNDSEPAGHSLAAAGQPPQAAEVSRVAEYVADHLAAHPDTLPELEAIEAATGVALAGRVDEFRDAVIERLQETHPELLAAFAKKNRCTQYEACSLANDLASATGETRDMYAREKAEDGARVQFAVPKFRARTVGGEDVASTALAGKPTVLAFVAVHCGHSLESLPILQHIQKTYRARGVQVTAVYLNSGPASEVAAWFPLNYFEKPAFGVWATEDNVLGDRIASHLVPTYLLVDSTGTVRRKLVGFQSQAKLERAVEELVASAGTGRSK